MSTRPKIERMSPSPSPSQPPSKRRDAAIQELRRGTQLAARLRQQVELIPELGRREAAVANVSEISKAMASSLSMLQSESEHSSESGSVDVAACAAYSSDGGSRVRNGAVARARKVRHRRGEELQIIKEILTEAPENDGFHWRKYGEKKILNAEYTRLYYKCGYSEGHKCPAKKYVQQQNSKDPPLFMVTFVNEHTCNTMFPDEPTSSTSSDSSSQILDFTKPSLSHPLMEGALGVKQEEAVHDYGYSELSSSLPSMSPKEDQVKF